MSTTLSGPSSTTSCANTVFTECAVADCSVYEPAAFGVLRLPRLAVLIRADRVVDGDRVGPVPARVEAEALVHRFGEGEGLERGARLPPVPPRNVARFNCDVAKSRPPAMARTWPVAGSIATSAAPGSPGVGRCDSTAASAAAW